MSGGQPADGKTTPKAIATRRISGVFDLVGNANSTVSVQLKATGRNDKATNCLIVIPFKVGAYKPTQKQTVDSTTHWYCRAGTSVTLVADGKVLTSSEAIDLPDTGIGGRPVAISASNLSRLGVQSIVMHFLRPSWDFPQLLYEINSGNPHAGGYFLGPTRFAVRFDVTFDTAKENNFSELQRLRGDIYAASGSGMWPNTVHKFTVKCHKNTTFADTAQQIADKKKNFISVEVEAESHMLCSEVCLRAKIALSHKLGESKGPTSQLEELWYYESQLEANDKKTPDNTQTLSDDKSMYDSKVSPSTTTLVLKWGSTGNEGMFRSDEDRDATSAALHVMATNPTGSMTAAEMEIELVKRNFKSVEIADALDVVQHMYTPAVLQSFSSANPSASATASASTV